MKRFWIFALALVLVLSMFACGKKAEPVVPADPVTEEESTSKPTEAPTAEPTEEPTPEPTEEPVWETAELEHFIDEAGNEMISIRTAIPAKATLRIAFPLQDDYQYTNNSATLETRKVRVPVEVFFPDGGLTEVTGELTPQITIKTENGALHEIPCPSFTVGCPMPAIQITSAYETDESRMIRVKAGQDGVYTLTAEVEGEDVTVQIDGQPVPVSEGTVQADLSVREYLPTEYSIRIQRGIEFTMLTIVVEP